MPVYKNIHVVDSKRTPIGRFGGALKSFTAAQLGIETARAVASQHVGKIDSVIFGQVLQAGSGMNVSRQISLGIGIEQSVPACTINMVCGSGLKAVAMAADQISLGDAGVVLAGGTESMTNAPYFVREARFGARFGDVKLVDCVQSDGLTDAIGKFAMGEAAEVLAEKYGISREAQDSYAVQSQQRFAAAAASFAREIVPVKVKDQIVATDEHPRPDTSIQGLSKLRPSFRDKGTVTAGNSSGVNDGAAALLIAGEASLKTTGLPSRGRIIACCATGCAPEYFGIGPVGAIRKLCQITGWDLANVDAVEINEAFAVQTLACKQDLKLSDEQLNTRGGAIALGHPIGCSGARVLVTLLHVMEDRNLKRGIASLCIGGGMGIAMAIER
jgi:acetyl-CoA C-acetyltransferase